MNVQALKYASVLTGPIAAYIAFTYGGWWTFTAMIYVFICIPFLDLLFHGTTDNLSETEEKIAQKDPIYDWLLYIIVPIQYAFLVYFLFSITQATDGWQRIFAADLTTLEIVGRTLTMGVLCAIFGINVAHELGHRATKHEQFMSKSLLLTTLYMHFFVEHNRGHHKNVATPEDPASARYGEWVYTFWIRSVIFSYISAWKLEAQRLKRRGKAVISIHNEMIWYQVLQLGLVVGIYIFFGGWATVCFILAAIMGFLLLETINYVEHYGLQRKQVGEKRYEKILPVHSWNSNHTVGRILLFELTRHSDHHFRASRKYQILRHFDEAPQMPTGYPGMVLLSLVPPLWFVVMHRQIDHYKAKYGDVLA